MPSLAPIDKSEDRPEVGSIGRDMRISAISVMPGAAITLIGLVVSPSFVVHGWPLFAILTLGLFAGSVSTLGSRPEA